MSSERDRRDAKINLSARRARPEDSNTLTRRGREGGGSLGRGRVPAPFPVLPSPGRHVGRAEAPGRVGAPGLWPRVGCTSVSGGPGTPRPRVPAWSLRSEQVSAAAGPSPYAAPWPGVARSFPIPQKGTPRPRGDSAPGDYFRGRFSGSRRLF